MLDDISQSGESPVVIEASAQRRGAVGSIGRRVGLEIVCASPRPHALTVDFLSVQLFLSRLSAKARVSSKTLESGVGRPIAPTLGALRSSLNPERPPDHRHRRRNRLRQVAGRQSKVRPSRHVQSLSLEVQFLFPTPRARLCAGPHFAPLKWLNSIPLKKSSRPE